ncbi:MAG: DNA-3-methyladenine glycosylase I [Pseudomonadales bacterium]|nr:DNA-3-methyladenine glycosylase I [Pseudomonadales bacterium]
MTTRCWWPGEDALYIDYHDKEWGVPVRDDRKQFEFLCLEGQQAGLSWITVLRKREHYRRKFHDFDPIRIAAMTDAELEQLLLDPGLIRNRLKLFAIRHNAQAFLAVQQEFGSFSSYLWSFVGDRPIDGKRKNRGEVPATSKESDALSKALKQRGFKFIGSTIVYAHMQASGMVNDHLQDCFRYHELATPAD